MPVVLTALIKNADRSIADGYGLPVSVNWLFATLIVMFPSFGFPRKSYRWALPELFCTPSTVVGSVPEVPFIVNPSPAAIKVAENTGIHAEYDDADKYL